jgi:hypothetical protein
MYPASTGTYGAGFASWNGVGSPSLPFVQNYNPYLHDISYDGSVGIGMPAGNGINTYPLDNPLPQPVSFTLGDQGWSRTGLPTYAAVPPGVTINFIRISGAIELNDGDTWRLLMRVSGVDYYTTPLDSGDNPLSPVVGGGLTFFATQVSVNPATGLAWTRAQVFAAEFGLIIDSSAIAGTTSTTIAFYPFYGGNPFTNRRFSWFHVTDTTGFYVTVDYRDGSTVTITGSGGMAVAGDLAPGGGGGFDLRGLQLQVSGGATGGGGGATGVPATLEGCLAGVAASADSGGIAGCPAPGSPGSDSGGGSGCGVSL